jgi:hypothetical protein
MLNPDLFKRTSDSYRGKGQIAVLKERLEIVREKYLEGSITRSFYIAAMTEDAAIIHEALGSESEMLRFAALSNSHYLATKDVLNNEPLAYYALAYNQSTPTEILDEIGMGKKNKNPVVRALIEIHPHKSQELAAFYALSPKSDEEEYDDSSYDFFWEAMGYETEKVDLDAMKALTYLDLLNVVEVPGSNDSFWYDAILENETRGLKALYEFYASMPQDASGFYYDLCVMRCWAAEYLTDKKTLEALSEDDYRVGSGVGGFYWADSRSPRSCVVMNEKVSPDLVRKIYQEEISRNNYDEYLNGMLWRLACSPFSPQDVTTDIVFKIVAGVIKDEYVVNNLLVGEPDDFPQGLYHNSSLAPGVRATVNELVAKRGLSTE